jgi:hypothetical protein
MVQFMTYVHEIKLDLKAIFCSYFIDLSTREGCAKVLLIKFISSYRFKLLRQVII